MASSTLPQGSVLGPISFVIFANDLPLCSTNVNFVLFTDDTTEYSTQVSVHSLQTFGYRRNLN